MNRQTKTTEMIEISITFIIWLIFRYFCKKKYRPKYRLFEADTDTDTQKKADIILRL